jgi:hypothetical protein
MSNSEQQMLNWADDGVFERATATVDDKPVTNEADPSRRCATCDAVIGVNAVGCDECWRYCMGGTSQ